MFSSLGQPSNIRMNCTGNEALDSFGTISQVKMIILNPSVVNIYIYRVSFIRLQYTKVGLSPLTQGELLSVWFSPIYFNFMFDLRGPTFNHAPSWKANEYLYKIITLPSKLCSRLILFFCFSRKLLETRNP